MDGEALGVSTALAAFLVPMVSLIKRPYWPRQAKYALGMAAAFVCAIAGALVDGNVKTPSEFGAYAATALATSQTIYALYFADTALEERLSGE